MSSTEVVNLKDRSAGARPRARVRRRWALTSHGVTGGSTVVVQNGDHAPAGLLLDVLHERGLEPTVVRVDRGEQLPDPADHRYAVVLCGAGADLAQPWVGAEIDWIAEADRVGTSVFAVGAGAHLLALALGGDSAPTGNRQRGWITVSSEDPELVGPWFAWQDRVLRLPPNAQLIARNAAGPQAFRVGSHLGVQFHPEITPELIREWIPRSPEVLDYQGIQEATARDYPAAAPAARKLFAAFLDAAVA